MQKIASQHPRLFLSSPGQNRPIEMKLDRVGDIEARIADVGISNNLGEGVRKANHIDPQEATIAKNMPTTQPIGEALASHYSVFHCQLIDQLTLVDSRGILHKTPC